VEKGKRLLLAQAGEMGWHLPPGTRIAHLGLTEKVYADMREIADRKIIADWVREAIDQMQRNAAMMRSIVGLKEEAVVQKERAEVCGRRPGRP
jgi:DNA topoisomerase III